METSEPGLEASILYAGRFMVMSSGLPQLPWSTPGFPTCRPVTVNAQATSSVMTLLTPSLSQLVVSRFGLAVRR